MPEREKARSCCPRDASRMMESFLQATSLLSVSSGLWNNFGGLKTDSGHTTPARLFSLRSLGGAGARCWLRHLFSVYRGVWMLLLRC